MIYVAFGYSTGGVESPDSPTKYFCNVVLLVSLFPTKSSKGVFPIALLNVFPIFPILNSGLGEAPSLVNSNPSACIGIAV